METAAAHQITSDLRQSPAYAKYMTSIGWQVVNIDSLQVFIKSLGILGSIAKIQRVGLPLPWRKLKPVLRQHRVWMTKLEPINYDSRIKQWGFRQDNWPLLASKTLRLNLTQSLKDLEKQFKKDTRYSLRKAKKIKLAIEKNNWDNFYQLWKKANQVKKLWTPPKTYFDSLIAAFDNNCFCLTVNNLAGAFVLIHNQVAYYYYAGSLPEAKKQFFPYQVVWLCLQEATSRGCKVWDWEGIYDSRWPTKSWQGFTHFKKSFGGYELSFPGSFTRWL